MRILAYIIVFRTMEDNAQSLISHILNEYFYCLHCIHYDRLSVAVCEDTVNCTYFNNFLNDYYATVCFANIVETDSIENVQQLIDKCFIV
ncbi:unknown [Choristoneura occidentalis granulovirus]|uniref:Uncharacterized protein n=1 Tax=Choristoneura occidentalis granulovirus TaxID=364745 RepID=Q1A4P3_9BBAC|nr:unknown [Choristoneura fumiferana granulovirus]ABC61187.1 unknown [Choristoneura fumiferana granulovirus]